MKNLATSKGGAEVGTVIIVVILIIAAVYFFVLKGDNPTVEPQQTDVLTEEQATEAKANLETQSESTDIADIEADLEMTDWDAIEAEFAALDEEEFDFE